MKQVCRTKNLSRLTNVAGLILFAFVSCFSSVFGQNQTEKSELKERILTGGEVIERKIAKDEMHAYTLELKRGELLHITVEQRGINVVLALAANDAKRKIIKQIDDVESVNGTEDFVFMAEADGEYLFGVFASADSAPESVYVLKNTAPFASAVEQYKASADLEKSGDAAYQNKDYNLAILYHENALKLRQELPLPAETASLRITLGNNYFAQKKYEQAIIYYQKAAPVYRELEDKLNEGYSLINIGAALENLKNYEQSTPFYEQGLQLFQELKDRSNEADTLERIGGNLIASAKYDRAADYYRKALGVYRELKNAPERECDVLNTLGGISAEVSEYADALRYYTQALNLSRETKKRDREMNALSGIGAAQLELGEYDKAIANYAAAEKIAVELKDAAAEANIWIQIGLVHTEIGQYDKPFAYYEKARRFALQSGDKMLEANSLINTGVVYFRIGSYAKSGEYFAKSLKIGEELKDENIISVSLSDLGNVATRLKEYDKAIAFYEKSIPMSRKLNSAGGIVISNYYYGIIMRERGNFARAVALHQESVKLAHEHKIKKYEARSLYELGADYLAQNDLPKATANFEQALRVAREVKVRDNEARALDGLMNVHARSGAKPLAIFYGKQAINLHQVIRQDIKSFARENQADYLKDNERTYRTLVDLLIAEGRIAEAEQVLRMLKEEEYFAYVRRDDSIAKDLLANLSLTAEESAAFKRFGEIADKTTAAGRELGELQSESLNFEAGKYPKQTRLDELEKQIADANKVFNAYLEELGAKFKNAATGQTDTRVEVVSNTQALLKELNEPRTVVISTIAGEDKLNLIVTTADANRAHTVNISAADLNNLVFQFRDAVKNPAVDPRPIGKKLYDVLFPAALQKDLDGVQADTIIWSLDGTLRYVPVPALSPDGVTYLAERYASAVITLASRDKLNSPPTNRKTWTALGVGVSKSFENFSALAAVPEELCSVVNDAQNKPYCDALSKDAKQANGIISGRILPDEKFSLIDFKANLGRYKIVHIASHFSLNAGNETDSFLLLGEGKTPADRKLSLAAVREQFAAKFVGVELLTLSACNTAMTAGNKSNGLEVEGFGALAQRQGAKSVLATLWAVADSSTR
ncbi:MAG: tetratricopeptide repeat protein, partial [Pyrinomonadaceae bacterium]|nr:tetratricopeptide repeat protein [Pyrinomonadaceae bacterium]